MLAKIKTCCIHGLSANDIEVEVDIANGLPAMNIVGLPDVAVRESKERVRAAIKNSGFEFPMKRITINLAPADTRKEGSHFDLPIALGILSASKQIKEYPFHDVIVLGELSLDGKVNKINGVLPMMLEMYQKGIKKVILPIENAEEAKLVKGLECIGVRTLEDVIFFARGEVQFPSNIGSSDCFSIEDNDSGDFQDIKGQENLKRGLEIAAAGGHNILMIGPPGSGKTMAARRLPSILPKLTFEEAIEITKIYSVAGLLNSKKGFITKRPFRAPHHTISMIALTGGGRIPKPGEVSLSHYGVLFLDELPEFNKTALEVLRQPLEDGYISIARANGAFTYPAKFMLVAAMNPCPCGYYGSNSDHMCTCTPQQVRRYMGKISGPLLDRIDIVIETNVVNYSEMVSSKTVESSKSIYQRVEKARKRQLERYNNQKLVFNSQLDSSGIQEYCFLSSSAEKLLSAAFSKLNLSARGYHRILKVARTIADIEGFEEIEQEHVAEALQYRNLNRFLWG